MTVASRLSLHGTVALQRKATDDLDERHNANYNDSYETPAKDFEKGSGRIRVMRHGSSDYPNDRMDERIAKMGKLRLQQEELVEEMKIFHW